VWCFPARSDQVRTLPFRPAVIPDSAAIAERAAEQLKQTKLATRNKPVRRIIGLLKLNPPPRPIIVYIAERLSANAVVSKPPRKLKPSTCHVK
jgi:hypothetical protein